MNISLQFRPDGKIPAKCAKVSDTLEMTRVKSHLRRQTSHNPVIQSNYECQGLVDVKLINGRRHYLVKWKDYDETNNTWQPLSNLGNMIDDVLAFEKRNHNKIERMEGVWRKGYDSGKVDKPLVVFNYKQLEKKVQSMKTGTKEKDRGKQVKKFKAKTTNLQAKTKSIKKATSVHPKRLSLRGCQQEQQRRWEDERLVVMRYIQNAKQIQASLKKAKQSHQNFSIDQEERPNNQIFGSCQDKQMDLNSGKEKIQSRLEKQPEAFESHIGKYFAPLRSRKIRQSQLSNSQVMTLPLKDTVSQCNEVSGNKKEGETFHRGKRSVREIMQSQTQSAYQISNQDQISSREQCINVSSEVHHTRTAQKVNMANICQQLSVMHLAEGVPLNQNDEGSDKDGSVQQNNCISSQNQIGNQVISLNELKSNPQIKIQQVTNYYKIDGSVLFSVKIANQVNYPPTNEYLISYETLKQHDPRQLIRYLYSAGKLQF